MINRSVSRAGWVMSMLSGGLLSDFQLFISSLLSYSAWLSATFGGPSMMAALVTSSQLIKLKDNKKSRRASVLSTCTYLSICSTSEYGPCFLASYLESIMRMNIIKSSKSSNH